MRGPCAKRRVICRIVTESLGPGLRGETFIGENDCANPQSVCPRLPGEGYEKCRSICQQAGHAEIEAVRAAGEAARGATAYLSGHYWICEPCGAALRDAGVRSVQITYGA